MQNIFFFQSREYFIRFHFFKICFTGSVANIGVLFFRPNLDLNIIMARSRDWDELQHVWIEWHRKTGQKIKELYVQLVDLSNYAAQLNSKRQSCLKIGRNSNFSHNFRRY